MTKSRIVNGDKYYAVIVPDAGTAYVESFSCVSELVSCLQKYIGTRTQIFPFYGELWSITKGPKRSLVDNLGRSYLLTQQSSEDEMDDTFSLS